MRAGGFIWLSLTLLDRFAPATRESMDRHKKVGRITIVMLGCFSPLLVNIYTISTYKFVVVDVVVQGGGQIFLVWTYLVILNTVSRWLFRRVAFLRKVRAFRLDELASYGFACTNLVVGCLYCALAYNPRGTVKPDWTEKLG